MDPVTTALQLGFYVLFGVSVWQYMRRRGQLELSVVAIFGSIAALFFLTFLNALWPLIGVVARPLLIAILFAQPYLVVRLIGQIKPVAALRTRIALLASVASWTAVVLLPAAVPAMKDAGAVFAVFSFAAVEVVAATWFARHSRRRFGVARVRLASAAVATALFGISILIAGIASIGRAPNAPAADSQTATRLLVLFATLGYLGAFVPPRWFRRFVNRAASYELVRRLVAPSLDTTAGSLWNDLASTAREILGASRVTILSAHAPESATAVAAAPERPAEAEHPDVEPFDPAAVPLAVVGDPAKSADAAREGFTSTVELEIRPGNEHSERLIAIVEGRHLFADDDLALIGELAGLTAHAIDREEMLIGLGQARREADESRTIRASEARFRALLDADPNAILALDEEGRVTWATRQAGALFGCEVDRLIGTPLGDLVALHKDEATMPVGDRPTRSDTTGRRVDGTHFPAEIARSSFELDGRPFQVAVISDVAWRHEAAQMRDRFIGVLSHELRTPVTSIYGGSQLLLGRGDRLDAETRTELLTNVAAEAERLQRMIENLVALARIERGGEFGGARPVLVDRMIAQLVERERGLWPDVTIEIKPGRPVQMVAADEEYLAQIMRNLLSNAAKYSGAGSRVQVSVEDGEGEVIVRVQDDGPGLGEEDADRLFALYYRSARQAAAAPGAGIGLFVCKELVDAMGGRIWANDLPAGGAEFGFTIPAYDEEAELDDDTGDVHADGMLAAPAPPVAVSAAADPVAAATPNPPANREPATA
ncbi:MAG TPA: ATP-binding protein [Candidatus Limnocylindrales bacterium]|nr:ATP-binding protein [Candidatus Limnocylindrales bacterium]